MKTILVAVDFSPIADTVIRRGIEFAQAFDARLVLLHVIQPPIFLPSDGLAADGIAVTSAAERAADRRLARLKASLGSEHKSVGTRRLTGLPINLILEQAAKLPAEYIVIGSHGHGAVYDLLVGSTASGVLKKAKCPVVIVPAVDRPSARAAAAG